MLGIHLSDTEIGMMKKAKFKKIVQEKTKLAAFNYLMSQKEGHSKMDGISYRNFEKAYYLNSPIFDSESSQLLLALRTRTVRGIKNDFRGMFTDIKCPLMCGEDDMITHILECPVLLSQHTSSEISENANIRYQDVFSSDLSKMKAIDSSVSTAQEFFV